MTPRTIEVTKEVGIGCDDRGFFLQVVNPYGPERMALTRASLEKFRDAIEELLEGKVPIDVKVQQAIIKAWREVGEARRVAAKENDPTTAALCLDHQEILNGLAFVWTPQKNTSKLLEDDE